MSRFELFLLVVATANVAVVLEFVRRRKLLESYALLWIAVGLAGIGYVFARSTIDRVATAVGVTNGASLVFAAGSLFLLFVCMSLSMHVSRLEERVEVLAEEVALLRGVEPPAVTGTSDRP